MARLPLVVLLGCSSAVAVAAPAADDPRNFIGVPHEVPCPAIAPAKADPQLLAARGGLAGVLVDPEGFLRPEIGIPEAVALLGAPSLCGEGASPGYLDLYLVPRSPRAHLVELETKDGELIGIVVELDPPATVDMTALRKRHGKPRYLPAPMDSFQAGGETFDLATKSFTGQLMISHKSGQDPATAWQVHQVILRRASLADQLPEGFHTAADVDRLIGLTLRSRAPDPVDFYGTLGVVGEITGDHVAFGRALPVRNVAHASLEKRTRGGRDFVHAVTVRFARPIAIGRPTKVAGVARTIVRGKLTAITIVRDEP